MSKPTTRTRRCRSHGLVTVGSCTTTAQCGLDQGHDGSHDPCITWPNRKDVSQ